MITQFIARRLAGDNAVRLCVLAAAAATLLGSPATAAPLPDAIATVTPQASDGLGGSLDLNIGPTTPSGPANIAVYTFSINDGGSVKQRLPIEICSSAHAGTWTSYDIGGNAAGALTGVTVGPDVQFVRATETCQTINIDIDTGPLTLAVSNVAQTFPKNVNFGKTTSVPSAPPVNVTIAGKDVIQIRVVVRSGKRVRIQ
jgi:hypothetical protein